MIRPTITMSTQGRMISDARGGGGNSTNSTDRASAVPSENIKTVTAAVLEDCSDDHADIGMDLSSAEDEEEDLLTLPKQDPHSSIFSLNTGLSRRHSMSAITNSQPHNPQQQQQHVTDDSEASSVVPEYTKKKRRRPSESTSSTPSPSHWSTSPHTIQSQPHYETPQLTSSTDGDPAAALSNGSPDEENSTVPSGRVQPPGTTPPPPVDVAIEPDETRIQQQQLREHLASNSSTGAATMETFPQHQQVAPLDISYRYTPASMKLKESLLSRLSMTCSTGRIQVVRTLQITVSLAKGMYIQRLVRVCLMCLLLHARCCCFLSSVFSCIFCLA
jgi:hypothetical protein